MSDPAPGRPVQKAKGEKREVQREWRLAGVVAFAALALLVFAAALRIVWPFLSAIVIGGVLVVLTWPLYEDLCARLRGRTALAATVMLLGITLLLVLPAIVLVALLVAQANQLVQTLQSPDTQQLLTHIDLTSRLAWVHRWAPNFDPSTLSPQRLLMPVVQQVPGWVARNGAAVLGSVAGIVVAFFIVLLSAWYFYVEGEALLDQIAELSPLPRRYDRQFGRRLKSVIEATFRGQVMAALGHGVTTTVGLLITGVPGAVLWGAVAAVMSLVPMVGSATVWVPAAGYLAIQASLGHRGWWAAIFLLAWGVLVVSQIDNVLRPWVMKGQAEMPAIPLLISVLGGLDAFGFIGLLIGPLVFSLVKSIVDIYKEAFQDAPEGDAGNAPPPTPREITHGET